MLVASQGMQGKAPQDQIQRKVTGPSEVPKHKDYLAGKTSRRLFFF